MSRVYLVDVYGFYGKCRYKNYTRWWQFKHFLIFNPTYLGFHDPLRRSAYFWDGLVQPPTSLSRIDMQEESYRT